MRRYLLRTFTFERQIRQWQYNKNHSRTPVVGVGGRSIELYEREAQISIWFAHISIQRFNRKGWPGYNLTGFHDSGSDSCSGRDHMKNVPNHVPRSNHLHNSRNHNEAAEFIVLTMESNLLLITSIILLLLFSN